MASAYGSLADGIRFSNFAVAASFVVWLNDEPGKRTLPMDVATVDFRKLRRVVWSIGYLCSFEVPAF